MPNKKSLSSINNPTQDTPYGLPPKTYPVEPIPLLSAQVIPASSEKNNDKLGPPDDLSGASSSATFVIEACSTCYSVPSTALFTPEQTTASQTETTTQTSSHSTSETVRFSNNLTSIGSTTATTTGVNSSLTTTTGTATATKSETASNTTTATTTGVNSSTTATSAATATESGTSSSITTGASQGSATAGESSGTSTTSAPLPNLGPTISASGTSSAKNVAGKMEVGEKGRWIGIIAGMMGLWVLPMMI